jgi:hypothetical protein
MTIVDEDIVRDIDLAREVLSTTDCSIAVIQYGKIWKKVKGDGIKPMLELIEEMGDKIHGSVIGDRILGRASSLLCRYAKAGGVYSPQGTKTGIALLIMGGVPCQVDQLIPFINNRDGDGMCPFEKLLKDVVSPEEAFKILKENVLK